VAIPVPQTTRRRAGVAWLVLAVVLAGAGVLAWSLLRGGDEAPRTPAALTATPGTLKQVFASARGGETILLRSGHYATFAAGAKPSLVTLRPAPGASVRISLAFAGVINVRLEGMKIEGADISGPSHDVTIAKSDFTAQIVIHADKMSDARILLDGNRFAHIDVCDQCQEGRVQVIGDSGHRSGVVIANNVLGPGGNSDGIQNGGNGVRILHNTFVGIYGNGGRHIDALQLYGQRNTVVRGNYFHNVASGIMSPDGGSHERIEHNVFDTGAYPYAIMLGGDDGSVIRHNTLPAIGRCAYGMPCGILLVADGPEHRAGRGTVVEDNILGGLSVAGTSKLGADHHNLLATGGGGPGDRAGRPAFTGGAHPKSPSGFRLAHGSPGRKAASDGADVGIAGGVAG
jgi:hypothetical protein